METVFNLVVLACYFFIADSHAAYKSPLQLWPWCLFAVYYVCQHYKEIWEDTARVIAGVYLLQLEGTVDKFHHNRILRVLRSTSFVRPINLLVGFLSVATFSALLLVQGWAVALVAWFIARMQPKPLPRFYQHHLRRLQKHLRDDVDPERAEFYLAATGDSFENIMEVVDYAVQHEKQPRKWAAEIAAKNKET